MRIAVKPPEEASTQQIQMRVPSEVRRANYLDCTYLVTNPCRPTARQMTHYQRVFTPDLGLHAPGVA